MTTANIQEQTGKVATPVFALVALTTLFFIWGFITSLNDILIPHLKNAFDLSYTQAVLIQFCFFGAYFFISIPAGRLVKRIGYRMGIVVGLLVASIGCLLFIPAATVNVYTLFLAALFILASGITLLQVAANPYVNALGSEESAASRLTMTQAFNSLGTTLAPWFGALLILPAAAAALHSADSVKLPYFMLAVCLAVLALIFSRLKLPEITMPNTTVSTKESLWSHRHLVLGVICIFMYVGAEVAIGSFLVNFMSEAQVAGLEETEAAKYLAYYWGGAMVFRFVGAALMRFFKPGYLLAFNALAATVLIAVAVSVSGPLAMWCLLAVGLCNSIMFPTIFSLAITKLGAATSQASGLLCLAIVGGAIVPLFQGMAADAVGLQLSFLLPLLCYIYILYYGLLGSKVRVRQ